MTSRIMVQQMEAILAAQYSDAKCELLAADPWQLLVAVILSARTSDQRVNQVMAVLNEHFISVQAFAALDPRELEPIIARVPLSTAKARYIVESARLIVARHHGRVPSDRDDLERLPGVGSKTAAVVLGNAFAQPMVAVDSHVQRLVRRFGWVDHDHPQRIAAAVERLVTKSMWTVFCHRLIRLGREHCRPKRPWCSRCSVAKYCQRRGVTESR